MHIGYGICHSIVYGSKDFEKNFEKNFENRYKKVLLLQIKLAITITPSWWEWFVAKAQEIMTYAGLADKKLSLLICDVVFMRQLNHKYRRKNEATDVLSWRYSNLSLIGDDDIIGEIAICFEKAAEQSLANGWHQKIEILRLFVHGLAHILGYDHEESLAAEKKMLQYESSLLAAVGLENIYPEFHKRS